MQYRGLVETNAYHICTMCNQIRIYIYKDIVGFCFCFVFFCFFGVCVHSLCLKRCRISLVLVKLQGV